MSVLKRRRNAGERRWLMTGALQGRSPSVGHCYATRSAALRPRPCVALQHTHWRGPTALSSGPRFIPAPGGAGVRIPPVPSVICSHKPGQSRLQAASDGAGLAKPPAPLPSSVHLQRAAVRPSQSELDGRPELTQGGPAPGRLSGTSRPCAGAAGGRASGRCRVTGGSRAGRRGAAPGPAAHPGHRGGRCGRAVSRPGLQ